MKRIIGIILIVIGALSSLFLKNYNGDIIPFPTLLFFLGLIILLIGIWLQFSGKSKDERILKSKMQEEINRLKQTGRIVNVDFKDCEIESNNYYNEISKTDNYIMPDRIKYKIQAWDSIFDSGNAVENVEINQSRIVYKDKNSNTNETYVSGIISKDKITLSFYLDKFEKTKIYVDKDDKELYYFDLEFLNNSNS